MKIAPRAIESYLTSPDRQHRAALFYGPDNGLARERAHRLADAMLGGNRDPFAIAELAEDRLLADPALLADELAAIHMLAPKRVIMLEGADKLTRIIEGAASYFHDQALLIVIAGELSARSSLRQWFEKEGITAAIACYRDEARDVQALIRKRFEAAGIRAGGDVVDYVSQQLGNDRGVTLQEIEKLITFAGEGKELQLEDARALVDYNRETGFDDAVNAVADRNVPALDATLSLLLREGTAPVAYLRALQRYFNRLYYIKAQMASGLSADAVIQGLRPPVFFKQVPILARHAQSWSIEAVVRALGLLIEAELACKTSDIPIIPASSRKLMQVTQAR